MVNAARPTDLRTHAVRGCPICQGFSRRPKPLGQDCCEYRTGQLRNNESKDSRPTAYATALGTRATQPKIVIGEGFFNTRRHCMMSQQPGSHHARQDRA